MHLSEYVIHLEHPPEIVEAIHNARPPVPGVISGHAKLDEQAAGKGATHHASTSLYTSGHFTSAAEARDALVKALRDLATLVENEKIG